MCEPTKLKFDLPIGTWGTTEVEVEYPWHRDLDSIILPLLETAHESQAEKQREQREIRSSEAYRASHPTEHRASELRSSEHRHVLPAENGRGSIPTANAAKIIMSNSKRKKGKEKTLPSRPNEEVKVCLKGVESVKWMTMMRGDYFQNLLEAYAKECEPPIEVSRLKVFWKGKWVKAMETPDDLGLDADSKLEVYELVHTKPRIRIAPLHIPPNHQRDRSKASIKTILSNTSEERRSPKTSIPPADEEHRPSSAPAGATRTLRRRVPGDTKKPDIRTEKSSGYSTADDSNRSMSATIDPGELQMPAQIPSRENSGKTNQTLGSSNESGSLAAEYQAQCVAIHTLRSDTPANDPQVVHLTVQPPSQRSLEDLRSMRAAADKDLLQVPSSAKALKQLGISTSPLRPDPTPIQVPKVDEPPPRASAEGVRDSQHIRKLSRPTNPIPQSAIQERAPPFIPPLRSTKSREESMKTSVQGYRYQNAVLSQQRHSMMLAPAQIETTIEAPGGRRVSSTYRTSWPNLDMISRMSSNESAGKDKKIGGGQWDGDQWLE